MNKPVRTGGAPILAAAAFAMFAAAICARAQTPPAQPSQQEEEQLRQNENENEEETEKEKARERTRQDEDRSDPEEQTETTQVDQHAAPATQSDSKSDTLHPPRR